MQLNWVFEASLEDWVLVLSDLAFVLDGSFYVWLEYLTHPPAYDETSPLYQGLSGGIFAILILLSLLLSILLSMRLSMRLSVSNQLPSATKGTTDAWKDNVKPVLQLIFHLSGNAHLIGGILASLSHLGSFENDNDSIFMANQAKWKHVFAFPLIVICTMEIVPWVPQKPVSFLLSTQVLQLMLAVLAVVLALVPLPFHDQHQSSLGHGFAKAQSNLLEKKDPVFLGLCPLAVALSSHCTFVATDRKLLLPMFLKALLAGSVFIGVQWVYGGKRNISLVEQWHTWPLLLSSCVLLAGNQISQFFMHISNKKKKRVTHLHIGFHLFVLLMGIMLSSSNLVTRAVITLILGIAKVVFIFL